MAYAAWMGAAAVCNPYKLSIAGLMFVTEPQREVYREVERVLSSFPAARRMDRDRNALDAMGAW